MPHLPLLVLAALAASPAGPPTPPAASAPGSAEASPPLSCEKGPLYRTFGGTAWVVYGCEDKTTLAVAAGEGNPAAPFYFILNSKDGERELYGEGAGDKKATAPAFEDLKRLDTAALAGLLAAAERAEPPPPPAPPPAPATRARLKQPNLFADLDYPPAAIRAGEEGAVEFELRLGPNGRVEGCTILVSSGSAILDSETCRMIRTRARFVPALDFEGRATWDSLRGRTTWRLPQ
ncbi:MAG TPA: energy transducer TonB [Allosphingosinicella sp.]|jgi:protein TonB